MWTTLSLQNPPLVLTGLALEWYASKPYVGGKNFFSVLLLSILLYSDRAWIVSHHIFPGFSDAYIISNDHKVEKRGTRNTYIFLCLISSLPALKVYGHTQVSITVNSVIIKYSAQTRHQFYRSTKTRILERKLQIVRNYMFSTFFFCFEFT